MVRGGVGGGRGGDRGGWEGNGLNSVKALSHSDSYFEEITETTFQTMVCWSVGFQKIISEKMFVCESIPCIAVILQYYNVILLF